MHVKYDICLLYYVYVIMIIKNLIQIKKHEETNCNKCKKLFTFKDHRVVLLGLTRLVAINKQSYKPKDVKIKFDQLFTHKNNNIINDYKCETCGHKNKELKSTTFYNFEKTKYLIIRIEICFKNHFLNNVKITDFNPDYIKIPGSNSFFRLMTAILFYPNDVNNPRTSGGHYTCLKRVEKNKEWIEIDDLKSSAKIFPQFSKNFENVYILVLEKIK